MPLYDVDRRMVYHCEGIRRDLPAKVTGLAGSGRVRIRVALDRTLVRRTVTARALRPAGPYEFDRWDEVWKESANANDEGNAQDGANRS